MRTGWWSTRATAPRPADPRRVAQNQRKIMSQSHTYTYKTSNQRGLPMRSTALFLTSLLAGASLTPALAAGALRAAPPGVSVAQIVEKHVAARGGVKAWHAVQTLAVSGKLDAGAGDSVTRSITMARQVVGDSVKRAERAAAQAATKATAERQVQLPFRLEMKRPSKSRLEIDFAGKTAVQVYDGQQGWKLRQIGRASCRERV